MVRDVNAAPFLQAKRWRLLAWPKASICRPESTCDVCSGTGPGHLIPLRSVLTWLMINKEKNLFFLKTESACESVCWGGVCMSILENPHWIRRRRDRLLCAPQARPAHTRQRAHCLLACLASSCSAITATAVQPSSTAHCGIGRRETRVQVRRLRTPVHTACSIVVIGSHLTALPPPIHLPLPLASPKTKTPRSLGDILTD